MKLTKVAVSKPFGGVSQLLVRPSVIVLDFETLLLKVPERETVVENFANNTSMEAVMLMEEVMLLDQLSVVVWENWKFVENPQL